MQRLYFLTDLTANRGKSRLITGRQVRDQGMLDFLVGMMSGATLGVLMTAALTLAKEAERAAGVIERDN